MKREPERFKALVQERWENELLSASSCSAVHLFIAKFRRSKINFTYFMLYGGFCFLMLWLCCFCFFDSTFVYFSDLFCTCVIEITSLVHQFFLDWYSAVIVSTDPRQSELQCRERHRFKKIECLFLNRIREWLHVFTSLTAKYLNFSITFISSVDFQMETTGFPFPDHVYFDDFTLLFSRGRLRNVQNFKTHVLSHCFSH